MALYRYKAVAPTGETLNGQMEAASRDEVVLRLQDAGNLPIEAVEAGAGGGFNLEQLLRRSAMSQAQIVGFTQQLGTLLGAGQPLDRALHMLSEQPDSEEGRRMVERIKDAVRGGSTLSTALEQQHGVFSRLYVNMVRAGEVSGSLTDTLRRLAEYLERSRQLKGTVVNALIYPAILIGMVILSLVTLMVYVVPNFEPIFTELGDNLPLITKVVLAIAGALQGFWWLMLIALGAGVWWMNQQWSKPESRALWEARLLAFGKIGELAQKVETARLARTLGTLLQNGVPLLNALSIAKNVLGNTVLAAAVEASANEVKTGSGLAFALGASKKFPRLALQMIAVGEEAGELDGMLMKVADTYDTDVRNSVERLLAALVPALTVLMAVMIGMIMLAIILPILDMSSLVE
ncbi:MAG: type II secretion system F family protein [Xanthomonadales bacterium]|nr:type II secretion system F family protein [Xanthomonadales bacterium]MBK7144159.1 type II secretion system F family protein [Xanthomonadales bacterium]MCC6559969.1 type II secretion system F family protein [Xanthomonadales bacterium]